jgi:hypothetical protein
MKELLLNTLLLTSLLSITGTVSQAQTATFTLQTPSVSTGAGSNPTSVTVADVNGDGNPDALVASHANSQLLVLLGNGKGGFTLQTSLPTGGTNSLFSNIAVADVNKDGKLDAVMADASPRLGKVLVLLGNGVGGFTVQANSPSTGMSSQPLSVAVADVNADSNPDVLAADYHTSRLLVLLGDGAGGVKLQPTVTSTSTASDGGPYSVAVADVNSDGSVDALVANAYNGTLGVLLGNGAGGFILQKNSPVPVINGNFGPEDLAIADVNGDNKPDVLTANSGDDTIGVLLGNGAGGFTSYANYSVGGNSYTPLKVAVSDINGDGKLDALTTNYNNSLSVFIGNGAGGFTLQPTRLVSNTPLNNLFGLALSDVNRDGKPDAIVVNSANRTLMVFLNTSNVLSTRAILPGTNAYLYPNPAQNIATLTFAGLPTSSVRVQATLLDALGRMIGQYTLGIRGGLSPLTGLTSGIYVVRLAAQDGQGLGLGELPVQRLSVD